MKWLIKKTCCLCTLITVCLTRRGRGVGGWAALLIHYHLLTYMYAYTVNAGRLWDTEQVGVVLLEIHKLHMYHVQCACVPAESGLRACTQKSYSTYFLTRFKTARRIRRLHAKLEATLTVKIGRNTFSRYWQFLFWISFFVRKLHSLKVINSRFGWFFYKRYVTCEKCLSGSWEYSCAPVVRRTAPSDSFKFRNRVRKFAKFQVPYLRNCAS